MGEITIPYKPRDEQQLEHDRLVRFNVLVCHRRWGKTVFAINQLIRDIISCSEDNPRGAYVAPLLKQAKAIAWDYLKYFSRAIPGIIINESELRIDYPNAGRIRLYGADNPDSLRGLYHDSVVLDEVAQMSPRLWSEVIRPALSDRLTATHEPRAIFIGTIYSKSYTIEPRNARAGSVPCTKPAPAVYCPTVSCDRSKRS